MQEMDGVEEKEKRPVKDIVVERASPLSTSPCRHPRLTSRHRACRDVASARTVDRQFESCCGSVRTSRRPSPLSLLSGISTATHYIHTYYILISGRLTLHWCQNCLTFALCFAFLSFSSVFFSFSRSSLAPFLVSRP